jgi:hypothetical protein
VDWLPVPRKLIGKAKKALDYVVRDPREIIKFTDVYRYLSTSRMDFYNDVYHHPEFLPALAKHGIRVKKGRGRAGNAFVKERSATANGCGMEA